MLVASNEYHMSSSAVPVQPANDCVADCVLCPVRAVVQVSPDTVKEIAPQILSLVGGEVTHISKVAKVEAVDV